MKKVYVCSSCRQENYDYVTDLLTKNRLIHKAFLFRPQPGQLLNKTEFANVDIDAINASDEVWLIGEYGRDCAWELGYAAGIKKPIKVFRCEKNEKHLEADWMMWSKAGYPMEVIELPKA